MAERSSGLRRPNTFPVPDEVVDEWADRLTGAEVKVLIYICRRTLGFYQRQDAISYSQFVHGIIKRDGTRLDNGAGISRGSLHAALKRLEELGLIVAYRATTSAGDRDTTVYAIHWMPNGGSETERPVVQELNDRRSETEPPVVQKLNEQETVLQETDSQEEIAALSRHILHELHRTPTPRNRASVAEKLAALLDGDNADWARVRLAVNRALALAGQSGDESEFWRMLARVLAMEGQSVIDSNG